MVKIKNIYGDVCTGRKDNAVYQRKYGQAMRRVYNDVKPPASPLQAEQRQKFQEGVDFANNLSREEKIAIKEYMKRRNLGWRDGEPIHWYNWAKSIAMKTPSYRVLDSITGRYAFNHPAILKVEEIDENGDVIFSMDDLSDIIDSRFQEQFIQSPTPATKKVRCTTLAGQSYEFDVTVVLKTIISFPCP